jgi:hypothetical protein
MINVPSVLTIVQHAKKKQLSGIWLVKKNDGLLYIAPFVAVDDEQKKRWEGLFRIGKFEILDLREPLDPEDVKYHIDNWVDIAKRESRPYLIASTVPFEVPGVPVEPFGRYGKTGDSRAGKSWPADWEDQGRRIFKDKRCELEGNTLARLLRFEQTNDLVKAFHAALWLAHRLNFFAVTAEEEQRNLLHKAGARPVRSMSDIRDFGQQWRQPHVAVPQSSPSAVRPQPSIFSPKYKGGI